MKQIYQIMALFIAVQIIGLFVGVTLINTPEMSDVQVTPMEETSAFNSLYFLFFVVLGAGVMLLLIKFYKGVMLFRLLESAVLFIASYVVFLAISSYVAVGDYPYVIAFILSIVFVGMKFVFPQTKNIAAVIASAGVGAVFGFSLGILPAVLFVIGLSIYDYISVFWTKHMITMAKELSSRQLSFSVSAPGKKFSKKKKLTAQEKEQQISLELGTGDMAIPLMLAVSTYKLGYVQTAMGTFFVPEIGLIHSAAVIIGSCFGLLLVLKHVMEKRSFLPALPPISAGAIIMLGALLLAETFLF